MAPENESDLKTREQKEDRRADDAQFNEVGEALASITGTLDTSGTAGAAHNNINLTSPAFPIAKVHDLEQAQRALDPDDDSVPNNAVITPNILEVPGEQPLVIANARVDAALANANNEADEALNPETVPGKAELDARTAAEDEATQLRREGTLDDDRAATEDALPTDMTGTLDTTGTTGEGHPSADDVSAFARDVERAGGDGSATGEASGTVEGANGGKAGADNGNGQDVPPYMEWTGDELRDELRNRELAVSGNKDEMAARLEADDVRAEQEAAAQGQQTTQTS